MPSASALRSLRHSLPAVALVVLVVLLLLRNTSVVAASSMPITGYVWSSNVGWISFSGSGYGVFEDTTSRVLSGYAWSSNVGWISFNASDATHPAPVADLITGQISGWIRACSAFADKNLCSGTLDANAGGWDGWISLSGTATNGSAYGWVQDTSCAWSGYAWGSTPIGWISASGPTYGVSGNTPSSCTHACTATLSASPSTVNQGQSTTLTWSVSGGSLCAATCSGNGFNTGGAISGSAAASVPPTPPSTSYALTCTGGTYGPPPPANTTVSVIVPTVALTANGQSSTARVDAAIPNNTTISWTATDAATCTLTKNGAAWRSGLGPTSVTESVAIQTTYAADCVNSYGTHATASVQVNVQPLYKKF